MLISKRKCKSPRGVSCAAGYQPGGAYVKSVVAILWHGEEITYRLLFLAGEASCGLVLSDHTPYGEAEEKYFRENFPAAMKWNYGLAKCGCAYNTLMRSYVSWRWLGWYRICCCRLRKSATWYVQAAKIISWHDKWLPCGISHLEKLLYYIWKPLSSLAMLREICSSWNISVTISLSLKKKHLENIIFGSLYWRNTSV